MAGLGNTIAELVVKVSADVSGLTKGLNAATGQVNGLSNKLLGTGAALVGVGSAWEMAVGGKARQALGGMIDDAKAYDEQVQIMKSITQDMASSVQDSLAKVAIKVGADTDLIGIDAMESMDAIIGFLKSGLDVDQIFGGATGLKDYLSGATPLVGALREAIDLAAASDVELAEAQQIVTSAMHVFGLGIKDISGLADTLVKAADASDVEVSQLGDAFGNVASIASGMKINFEDLSVALAILGNNGQKGAEGGTALKSMLMHISNPTKVALKLLDSVGVSFYDIEGNLKPLPQMFGELKKAMEGMTQQEADSFLGKVFGSYGLKSARIFLATGTEGWEQMEDAMAGASGAGEVAAVRTDAYAQAMENLQGAVQTFNIVAGAPLIENVLAPLVKWLTQVIGNLATAHPGFLKVVGVVLLVSAALGPLLIALGGLTMVIGGAGKAFSAFGGIAKGIGGLLGLLTGPAGPILLIVAALALLVIAWKNNWGDIQGITARVVESLKTFFSNLGASLAETWNSIKTGVVNAWNAIGDALYNAGQSVMRRLSEGIRAAVDWVTGAVGWVVQKIRDLLPGSDAKEGPLSDLFASGKALPMTMAQGILSGAGAVQSAGQRIAAMAKYGAGPAVGRGGPVPIGAGGASYAAPAGGAGQAITITVNNPTGQTSEASIVRQLRNLAYVGALAP